VQPLERGSVWVGRKPAMKPQLFSLTTTALALALGALGTVGACDQAAEDCVSGQEGCACREDQCLSGLSCRSGVCVDPDGMSDDDDDSDPTEGDATGSDPDGEAPKTCDHTRALTIGGALETDVSSVVFDYAEVQINHKRDVDEFEDGCVNDMFINLAAGDGCVLQVHALDFFTPQSRLMVQEVGFMADSQCPNFPDAAEGFYVGADTLDIDGSGIEGVLTIPQENTARACFSGEYTLHLSGVITRGSDILEIYPSQITLAGDFRSTSVERSCPRFP